jgi:cyclopropane-fatty-acyl-phospholipid synthase
MRSAHVGVAPDASNHHYDLPPELFALFLDENLKYSVGLFQSDADTLEEAQARKLEFIRAQLRVGPRARVLDAGCGWGSLVLHLAQHDCESFGITPSPQQADFVEGRARRAGLADRVHIHRGVFEGSEESDLMKGSFDAVTFVGSIVHMPDKAAVLRRAHRMLRHHGRLYLSETCFRSARRYRQFASGAEFGFIRDEIFGWGDIVPISDYVAHLEEAGFSLCGLFDLTANYRRTIAEWQRRADRNRALIEQICPGYAEHLLRYFAISNAAWGFTTKQYALVAARER